MSAMNVWVTKDLIAITTDTYCHFKTDNGEEIPVNFISKVYQIPQHKSCFTNQGMRDFGMRYFNFVQTEVKAQDISTLISYTRNHFTIEDFYLERPVDKIGTIFVFGLNDLTNRLEVYKIYFDEQRKINVSQLGENIEPYFTICKPELKRGDLATTVDNSNLSSFENAIPSLINIMKVQKEDDDLDNFNKVGIGGHIQLTIINNHDNYFSMQTSFIHKFDDYDTMYQNMNP